MNWLKKLVLWVKGLFTKKDENVVDMDKDARYHCVRIFRKEGDEIVMLLSEEEIERGISRAVQEIGVIPYTE
jgi:predicted ATP-grasp superfamily ATP-dependent carboligase